MVSVHVNAIVMVCEQYVAHALAAGGRPLTVNRYQVFVTGAAIEYGPPAAQLYSVAPCVPIVWSVPPAG